MIESRFTRFKKTVARCLAVTLWLFTAASAAAGERDSEAPDWLPAHKVRELLVGNTITAMSRNDAYRWWTHYHSDEVLSWRNDRGRTDFGYWHVALDGTYCVEWESGSKGCMRVRHSGVVVRFHHLLTGKERFAAVLRTGDPQDLKADVEAAVDSSLAAALVVSSKADRADAGQSVPPETESAEAKEAPQAGPTTQTAALSAGPALRIAVVGVDSGQEDGLLAPLQGVEAAEPGALADLVWNRPQKTVRKSGLAVAYLTSDRADELQPIVDRWRLVQQINHMMVDRSRGMALQKRPPKTAHRVGEALTISLSGHRFKDVLLFNIGPNGARDLIYPISTDFQTDDGPWPGLPPGLPLSIPVVATPPFGTNHLVAVASPNPPEAVLRGVQDVTGPAGDQALLEALKALDGQITLMALTVQP